MTTTIFMSREEAIAAVEKRDGPLCFASDCRKPFKKRSDITLDHWIPRSKGGTDEVENYRLMHQRCNALKGDRMPLEDGTLPPLKRELDLANRRADRSARPEVCGKCESGRLLGPFESCLACGSGPMPERFPRWAKVKPSECDHDEFWCWCCAAGIMDRKPVVNDLLGM